MEQTNDFFKPRIPKKENISKEILIIESATEAEVGNLKGAVIQLLEKKGGHDKLIKNIKEGKISLGLHEQKFLNMGKIAEKETEARGEEFDSTDFLITRANIVMNELTS